MVRAMPHDRAEWVPVVTFGREDGVYYVVESNIPGLNIEAERYEDFVEIAESLALELLGLDVAPRIEFRDSTQATA